jgi:hypothetical protein
MNLNRLTVHVCDAIVGLSDVVCFVVGVVSIVNIDIVVITATS